MLTLSAKQVIGSRRAIVRTTPEFDTAAGEGWLHRIMTEQVTDKLHEKQGRSIARWTLPPLTLFLKRHYRLSWFDNLLSKLVPARACSPGLQEWEHLQWAVANGFAVPRALAAAEWRSPLQSFLAVEELHGMLPLHEAIPLAQSKLSPVDFARWKSHLIRELARITSKLHGLKAFHKDLYLCHFYVAEDLCNRVPSTFQNRIVMIDLHRLGQHSVLRRHFQVKDLAQFLYSSLEVAGVSDRDRLRFWRNYRPGEPRWIRLAVLLKYRLYLRHARRKAARRRAG